MKPFITIIAAIGIIFIAYTQKAHILQLIHTGHSIALFISILFVALLVFFPVMPYPLVAGLIGSIFGVWQGIFISIIGVMVGCCIMFFMARYSFQQWVQKMLRKFPKAKEYEVYFKRMRFWGFYFSGLFPSYHHHF